MRARYLVTAMAAAVAGVAMYGSAASLHEIAAADHLAAAWTMPFCLDLLAITTTTAAVLARQRGALVHIGPPIAYLISLALQVSADWSYGPRAWATHAIPLVATVYLSEVLLRMWAPEGAASESADAASDGSGSAPVADLENPAEVAAAEQLVLPAAPAAPPPAGHQAAVGRRKPRTSVTLDELVRRAEEAAAHRGVAATDLSQATLKAELHLGSNRAVHVYRAIRRPALELVRNIDR